MIVTMTMSQSTKNNINAIVRLPDSRFRLSLPKRLTEGKQHPSLTPCLLPLSPYNPLSPSLTLPLSPSSSLYLPLTPLPQPSPLSLPLPHSLSLPLTIPSLPPPTTPSPPSPYHPLLTPLPLPSPPYPSPPTAPSPHPPTQDSLEYLYRDFEPGTSTPFSRSISATMEPLATTGEPLEASASERMVEECGGLGIWGGFCMRFHRCGRFMY